MRWKLNHACLLASLIALVLAACTSVLSEQDAYPLPPATQALATLIARGVATSDRTEYPPPIPGPLAPPPTVISEVQAYPSPIQPTNPNPDPPTAVQTGRGFLAGRLSLPVRQVRVISWQGATWITANLGCQPVGSFDQQNPIPGYLIRLEAQGQSYELHSDQDGEDLCLAEPLQPGERLPLARDIMAEETAELARSHLASRLGAPVQEVRRETFEPGQWEDASLGCPLLSGQAANRAQAGAIPGYRILLYSQDGLFEYHSGGFWLVYCGILR